MNCRALSAVGNYNLDIVQMMNIIFYSFVGKHSNFFLRINTVQISANTCIFQDLWTYFEPYLSTLYTQLEKKSSLAIQDKKMTFILSVIIILYN